MSAVALQVGELARRTRISVRTLHHYDQIGLVRPSLHSAAGYRLYVSEDIARLLRVRALRQLGFPLNQIKKILDAPTFSPVASIESQVNQLRRREELMRTTRERLEWLAQSLANRNESPEDLLKTLEAMAMIELHLSPDQLQELQKHLTPVEVQELGQSMTPAMWQMIEAIINEVPGVYSKSLTPEQIQQPNGQQEPIDYRRLWLDDAAELPTLMDALLGEVRNGTKPEEPRAQLLAKRFRETFTQQLAGGDSEIAQSLLAGFASQPPHSVSSHLGLIARYVLKALAAAGGPAGE